MIIRPNNPSALSLIRAALSPKSLEWETRKDTWFFLLSLTFGLGFCVLFGSVLFFLNR